MKTGIYTVFVLLLATTAVGQPTLGTLNLTGTAVGPSEGTIYLQRYENKSFFTIDSTRIAAGKFAFKSRVALPEIYGLSLVGSGEDPFDSFIIFLDDQPISVTFDPSHEFKNTVVRGSKEQDLLGEFSKQRGVPVRDIIKAHPTSLAALYYLYRYHSFRLTPAELRENIALLDPAFANTPYVQVLKELASTLEGIGIGNKAPDFTAYTTADKEVQLSDYLGGGYVLIDFWASWCIPCRAENPHLLEAYNRYKSKGFEIVGISLDNKNEPWIKAIAHDKLPWAQLIDRKAWAGEGVVRYGVRLIPANFLIDKNGVIVARNLKGEALEHELARLLGGHNKE